MEVNSQRVNILMKNILKVLAVAVFFTVIMLSVTALADNYAEGIVTADVLNIRSQPNTDSVILGQFPNGSNVTVTEAKDNWYKITYGQSIAFLCADYVVLNTIPNYVEEFTYTAPDSNTDNLIYTDIPSYVGSQIKGEILVENAKAYIGTPYVYGGMSPSGFDCSGFVKFCYLLMGVDINRVSYDQAKNGYEVPKDSMKPGDILCFVSSVGGNHIGHTGIYVGNGYFIHSPREGYNVEIIPLTYGTYTQRLTNVRRIFD